ncbi:restriction endonuclease subunit R, partial [Coprobacillus cateniformis]|nr:restriction endonuclease subunit R [Coprobacillus cateniformis]
MTDKTGYESEKILEEKLLKSLKAEGYEFITIDDKDELHNNFRKQINKHNAKRLNGHELSDKEFERLMLKVQGKGVFASSKILRNLQDIQMDDGTV